MDLFFIIIKQILFGISIFAQIIGCIITTTMIMLQKTEDGAFARSTNPLMYKSDNITLYNNTKYAFVFIALNTILLQVLY